MSRNQKNHAARYFFTNNATARRIAPINDATDAIRTGVSSLDISFARAAPLGKTF
jgi:hypothetical protein